MTDDAHQPPPIEPPRPQTVPTNQLRPNPHNPRVLFDEEPLQTLEASIRKVGILVPITVYQAAGSHVFTILDGQRRWICAQRIGLTEVPINQVTEPTIAQNIVTMFQIHKLRKDWDLMPTALKLGVLMDELDERRDGQLAELTGLDVAVVTRCKKLLSYPERFQDLMLDIDPDRRVKADFFIELYPVLNDRMVRRAEWYDYELIIDRFLDKYLNKLSGFRAITDFRKIKSYLSIARLAGEVDEIIERLGRFIRDDTMMISDLEIDAARIHREATTLTRTVGQMGAEISGLEVDVYAAEEDLWLSLESLLKILREKLKEAERREI